MTDLGKVLVLFGVVLVALGLTLMFAERLPLGLGRLPGDIVIRRENFTFYFPIVTSLLISLVLTLILNLIFGLRR